MRQKAVVHYVTRVRHFAGAERDWQDEALAELGYRLDFNPALINATGTNSKACYQVCIRNVSSWDLWFTGTVEECLRWIRNHEGAKR